MVTLKVLLAVALFGTVFLLATGLADLGRVGEDGRFEWHLRLDTAGLDRLGRRAWHAAGGAVEDAAAAVSRDDESPAPQQSEQILVLH